MFKLVYYRAPVSAANAALLSCMYVLLCELILVTVQINIHSFIHSYIRYINIDFCDADDVNAAKKQLLTDTKDMKLDSFLSRHAYNTEVTSWLRNHLGRAVTEHEIGELFNDAY